MRFFRIATGYLAAAYCATLPFLALIALNSRGGSGIVWELPYFITYGMFFSIPSTMVQSAVFVAISERLNLRRLPFYLGAGFATGLTAIPMFTSFRSFPPAGIDWGLSLYFAAGGAVCGTVYWAIAGRKAGLLVQTGGRAKSYIRCLWAGSIFSAALTGFETLVLRLNNPDSIHAVLLILCFLIHAAFGTYFACAFMQRKAAAAAP